MGRDQHGGQDPQRVGGGNEVGFMGHQKVQRRQQHHPLANPRAQFFWCDTGQGKESFRMGIVGQHPAQRGQSQRLGIGGRVPMCG